MRAEMETYGIEAFLNSVHKAVMDGAQEVRHLSKPTDQATGDHPWARTMPYHLSMPFHDLLPSQASW